MQNKKPSKALKICNTIIVILLVGCGIALLTCYFVNKEQTLAFINDARETFTRPLPIVGVSLAFIFWFLWNFLSRTSIGQKALKLLNENFELLKKEIETKIKSYEEHKNALQHDFDALKTKYEQTVKENDYLKTAIIKICDVSANKKMKEIGKEVAEHCIEEATKEIKEKIENGEERIDDQARSE